MARCVCTERGQIGRRILRTIGDILCKCLDDLSNNDFLTFQDCLYNVSFVERPPIQRGIRKIEDAIDLKNLIVDIYGEESVEVTVQVFRHMGLQERAELVEHQMEMLKMRILEELEKNRQQYMDNTRNSYKRDDDRNSRLGESFNLDRRFTKMLMVTKHRNYEDKEQELTSTGREHLQIMENRKKEYYPVDLETMFHADENGNTPELVVLQGPAGIGKTMAVKKIMFDWASEKLYKDRFRFVFCFSRKEVGRNPDKMSMAFFISVICSLQCTPTQLSAIFGDAKNVLFIIDGFDELIRQLDGETEVCSDPYKEISFKILLNSLLRKKYLVDATIMLTTRPFKLEKLREFDRLPRYVEMMGYTGLNRKEYFGRYFDRQEHADLAFIEVEKNEVLFTMCRIPLMCWIVSTVLKPEMEKGIYVNYSRTTTCFYQLYVKCLTTYQNKPTCKNLFGCLKQLCALARDSIWKQQILFDKEDLSKYGLSLAETESLFLNESIFQQDAGCQTFYSFVHLSVQEFCAALYYFLIDDGYEQSSLKNLHNEMIALVENSNRNPHLISTARFLFGLCGEQQKEMENMLSCELSKKTKSVLEEWLKKTNFKPAPIFRHLDEQKYLNRTHFKMSSLYDTPHYLNYLFETQDEEMVQSTMKHFSEIHCSYLKGSALEYRAICYCLMTSGRSDHAVNFSHCVFSKKTLDWLSPGFKNCAKLQLRGCNITPAGCVDLHSVITTNKSLIELDLSENNLQGQGLLNLCDGLISSNCTLKELRLSDCSLTSACCEVIYSILTANKSLDKLDLSENTFQDAGVKRIIDGLENQSCTLRELKILPSNSAIAPALVNTVEELLAKCRERKKPQAPSHPVDMDDDYMSEMFAYFGPFFRRDAARLRFYREERDDDFPYRRWPRSRRGQQR
ncbi:NACHT, LRR and PYD domains-containing protein 3-like [Discoglossus pictus]